MQMFIDTSTGTWGNAEDIVFLDAEPGPEAAMLINTLENLSDDEIIAYGNRYGDAPVLSGM